MPLDVVVHAALRGPSDRRLLVRSQFGRVDYWHPSEKNRVLGIVAADKVIQEFSYLFVDSESRIWLPSRVFFHFAPDFRYILTSESYNMRVLLSSIC